MTETIKTHNFDAWTNIITGLGTSRDKRTGRQLLDVGINRSYQTLDTLYSTDDVAQTIAELIPKEMVREWIEIFVKEEEEESANVAQGVTDYLDVLDAQESFYLALTWARVFGTGALFIGANDGNAISDPLQLDRIQSVDFLIVFDRWQLQIEKYYSDPQNPKFGKPELYRVVSADAVSGAMPDQVIHETRLIRLEGTQTTRLRKQKNGGFSESVFTRLYELIGDYQESWSAMFHLIQDFAAMVYKFKGLADALAADNDKAVINRLVALDMCKSVVRGIVLDADGEEAARSTTPVTGLSELLNAGMVRLSQATRIPVTLLMGQSPKGLNATGQSDISFFYDQIKAKQEADLRKPLNYLIKLILLAKNGPTKGIEPESWSFAFKALWQLGETEKAAIRKTQAEADAIYLDRGVLFEEEVANSRFGGAKYSSETMLDKDLRDIEKTTRAFADDKPEDLQKEIDGDEEEETKTDKIEKRGGKWLVVNSTGEEVLGEHETEEEAIKQLRAIEAAKAAR